MRAESSPRSAVAVRLRALTVTELEPLFHGPERVFHLPSDGARALWSRTGGLAARVSAEVAAWVRAGVARWDGARLALDRRRLDGLSLGAVGARVTPLRAAGHSLPPRTSQELSGDLADVLEWVALAGPSATTTLLERASGIAAWRIEASLAQLEALGRVRRTEMSTWEPSAHASAEPGWTIARRRAAHASLAEAFEPGTEGRLSHLVSAACLGDPSRDDSDATFASELAREAVALARRRAAEASLGPASAALAEALLAARRLGLAADAPEHLALLATWVELALAEGTPHALDRVHYEICRSPTRTGSLEHLAALVRAALAARSGGDRGLALADSVAPFDDLGLELGRHGVRVLAARRTSIEREEAVVEALRPWAEAHDDPRARASLIDWLGRLRYRQCRFEESAAILDSGVRPEVSALHRMGALAGAASAWLEALRPDLAMERAATLRDEAARCRHVYFEAWAEHLSRAAAYRAGVAGAPSSQQVEVLAMVGVKDLEALSCLTEAAFAWRAGDVALARALSTRGHAIWAASGWAPGAGLSRALSIASGASAGTEDIEALVAWSKESHLTRVAVQILGLLASAGIVASGAFADVVSARVAGLSTSERASRLEVLSLDEAVRFCGG